MKINRVPKLNLVRTLKPWFLRRASRLPMVVSLSAILLFPALPLFSAQAPSREELLFMEIPTVVTPARREQPLTKAPSTTTVITAEEIRRSGATNLPDLFRNVPGIDFFRISASDVNITARGLNTRLAHRMQVYIDGRAVYEDFLNLVFWHQLPVSLQEIERIEIVKSPTSALFGANAFSGVIHIITKSPEKLKGTQISETAGSSDTYISNLLHAGVSDQFGYKLSFEHDRTNHFPNPDIGISNRDKGREDFRGSLFGEYKFNEDSRLSLAAGMDSFERDVDPGIVPGGSVRVFADGGLGFVKLNYSLADFKFQFSWDRLDMDLRSTVLPEKASVLADSYKLDLQHSVNLGKRNVLTGGASYRLHKYHSRFLIGPDRRQNIFAVFLQDEYSPWDNLTVTLGVRLDTHPQTGVNVSPRGSIVYSPWENHTFRFSVARAFRNPSILENFVDFPVVTPLGTAMIRGNRNLQPEEITSYELGYQALLSKRVKARLDLFYNVLDKMSTGLTPVAPLELGIFAGGGGSVFGGEVAFEVLFSEWLKGFVNYSYQNRDLDRTVLGLGPNHKGNVGFSLTLPNGFEADLSANTVGSSKGPPGGVGSYTLVNLRLGYAFEGWGVQGRLFLGAFNLFNDRHREFRGGDMIERRITGGLQIKF